MKIAVCIKQVPAGSDAKIDPETKRIIREGSKSIVNPFDLYAIEEALAIREQAGGEVIALSMGPEKAKSALIEALSMGADRAVLLSDRAFGGSDTWATSYVLAKAIETIGSVDLILCGKQAIDGDTAQVGAGIAAKLDIRQAANVWKVERIEKEAVTVKRLNERGYDIVKLKYPALITVVKDINSPRIPKLHDARIARRSEIPIWKPENIGADPDLIGLQHSPTQVVRTAPPPARDTEALKIDAAPDIAAARLVNELLARKLVQGLNE